MTVRTIQKHAVNTVVRSNCPFEKALICYQCYSYSEVIYIIDIKGQFKGPLFSYSARPSGSRRVAYAVFHQISLFARLMPHLSNSVQNWRPKRCMQPFRTCKYCVYTFCHHAIIHSAYRLFNEVRRRR